MATETDSRGEPLWGPIYKDRSFCSVADKCAVADCRRRLTDEDKRIIVKDKWLVAYIPSCPEFKPKEPDGEKETK